VESQFLAFVWNLMPLRTVQRSVVFGVAILAGISCSRCAGATNARDMDESCRTFVEQFYNYYEPLEPGHTLEFTSLGDAVEKKQFDPLLVQQLRVVLDTQAKSGQMLLDIDPIINDRDAADKYVAGSVTRKGEHYLVEVYGVSDDGRKHHNPDVIAELVFQTGEWTFVNFHYPNRADSAGNENLLSMLKRIRKSLGKENHSQPSGSPEGAPR
jgi:hypothetical protein